MKSSRFVLCKGGSRVGERGLRSRHPRRGGVVWGGGAPSPTGEGAVPPPRKFFELLSRNGAFLCILQSAAVILGSENA